MKSSPLHYDHKSVEARWRSAWEKNKTDVSDIKHAPRPYYNLMMFPYPSAEGLHVGNMYAFTGSDIYGRFKRMSGYEVFEPIGLDGFGIHSENYALKVGRHPMEHAQLTEKNFYDQLHKIGAMYDWSRTVETYDPDYYKWTQWIFVEMYKRGLAYRAKSEVNWCPSCKTVLADEQVIEGKCERCGNAVINKLLEQWFFKITAYAEKLLANTRKLNWSEKILIAQRNWIGKKTGINIDYQVKDRKEKIVCFTTTPVNWAATFLVLSPEHPMVLELTKPDLLSNVKLYIDSAKGKKPEERIAAGREKTGVFTGSYAINHVTGEELPIWVSDFVIMSVGTGAIQACPGHDLRDFEFAKKYNLPIRRVVVGPDGDNSEIVDAKQVIEHGPGVMVNSDILNGLEFEDAMEKTKEYFEKKGWGERVNTYHLRDWLISRQRYWGPPIPMIYCEVCAKSNRGERADAPGWWTLPEKDLPVVLPRIEDYQPKGTGVAPLATHKEFYEVNCPSCGSKARRETDVSDTFLDSSWYFLRYPSVGLSTTVRGVAAQHLGGGRTPARQFQALAGGDSSEVDLPWDPTITKKWLPVDMYTGGAEHSVLHLMYSRFITMALKDWGYIDFEEPFPNFYAHGLIIKDGAKMSKSRGNIVTPDQYIDLYGADSLRLYLMFTGPFDQGGDFRDSAMEGMSRWVRKVWRMALNSIDKQIDKSSAKVQTALAFVIKKVGEDIEKRRYNTAIAAMMTFTNVVSHENGKLGLSDLGKFILILAPFAPFLSEELWYRLGSETSIHRESWPTFDPQKLVVDIVHIVVQVNGKMRDTVEVPVVEANDQKIIEALAKQSQTVSKYLSSASIKKVIFVPNKLINFVTSQHRL